MARTHEKFGPAVAVPPPVADPLHPVARLGQEVLRRGLNQLAPVGHRDRQEPDQAHVVVQGQPRHHHLGLVELGSGTRGIDVGGQDTVGDHHALGLAGRAAGVLQDDEPLGIVRRDLQLISRRRGRRAGQHACHQFDRRIAGGVLVEGGQQLVDQDELGIAVADATPGRIDEGVERTHPHRQRQHHAGDAGQPAPLDDRDQLPRGRTEDRDVVAGDQPTGLQGGADDSGLVVDLPPWNERIAFGRRHRRPDETHAGRSISSGDDAVDDADILRPGWRRHDLPP